MALVNSKLWLPVTIFSSLAVSFAPTAMAAPDFEGNIRNLDGGGAEFGHRIVSSHFNEFDSSILAISREPIDGLTLLSQAEIAAQRRDALTRGAGFNPELPSRTLQLEGGSSTNGFSAFDGPLFPAGALTPWRFVFSSAGNSAVPTPVTTALASDVPARNSPVSERTSMPTNLGLPDPKGETASRRNESLPPVEWSSPVLVDDQISRKQELVRRFDGRVQPAVQLIQSTALLNHDAEGKWTRRVALRGHSDHSELIATRAPEDGKDLNLHPALLELARHSSKRVSLRLAQNLGGATLPYDRGSVNVDLMRVTEVLPGGAALNSDENFAEARGEFDANFVPFAVGSACLALLLSFAFVLRTRGLRNEGHAHECVNSSTQADDLESIDREERRHRALAGMYAKRAELAAAGGCVEEPRPVDRVSHGQCANARIERLLQDIEAIRNRPHGVNVKRQLDGICQFLQLGEVDDAATLLGLVQLEIQHLDADSKESMPQLISDDSRAV